MVGLVACGTDLSVVTMELRGSGEPLRISAEIVATRAQRAQGLMGRRSLEADKGMLFLFPAPTRGGFWMKDTLIPLDIAFIGGGMVLEIRSMVPCKVATCPVTYPSVTYEQALEVAAGTFEQAGIVAGARVEIRGSLPSPT